MLLISVLFLLLISVVSLCPNTGAVIYLLDLFCNSKLPETREAAVELLARMMADKLHGPKVCSINIFFRHHCHHF